MTIDPKLLETIAVWIGKTLGPSALVYAAQKLYPTATEKIKVIRHTSGLDSPELLSELVSAHSVKTGEYVEGAAFFSLSTVSHTPMVPLMVQVETLMRGTVGAIMAGYMPDFRTAGYVLPTTKFPLVHDAYRVGFLYPTHMGGGGNPSPYPAGWGGFWLPLLNDGTVQSLPFQGRLICILPATCDFATLDNRLVKYRGRIITLDASDVRMAFPGISDDRCETLLADASPFLSMAEDNTYIEYYDNSPATIILGSHFLETHWEDKNIIADVQNFPGVLQSALVSSVSGRPEVKSLQYSFNSAQNVHLWFGRGIAVTQPVGLPYFHFQITAPLNDRPNKQLTIDAFTDISQSLTASINQHYSTPARPGDLDSIDGYTSATHTILQSSAARTIKEPVLLAVKNWLARSDH
ncbi:MAG TPA: hypothetical protein VFA43_03605 [Gemmatimonadaceae bacterium]|nr:hypothetical protein [Gemmatimonadaceae bacterium]